MSETAFIPSTAIDRGDCGLSFVQHASPDHSMGLVGTIRVVEEFAHGVSMAVVLRGEVHGDGLYRLRSVVRLKSVPMSLAMRLGAGEEKSLSFS